MGWTRETEQQRHMDERGESSMFSTSHRRQRFATLHIASHYQISEGTDVAHFR